MTASGLRRLIPAALFVIFAVAGYARWGLWHLQGRDAPLAVGVRVPDLSSVAQAGREVFAWRCAQCHGAHGGGGAGPPLVHPIYRPAHHADVAFNLAVARGVRAHHWRLGDMPPQPDVGPAEIAAITRYVRELQAANGIE